MTKWLAYRPCEIPQGIVAIYILAKIKSTKARFQIIRFACFDCKAKL
ncbi:hypothetical protein [Helicobacter sp.]|nr:hypothetical protein [Helicobacter sp.]MBD5164476.1 hypothetical protein [Helicobacter sp.]